MHDIDRTVREFESGELFEYESLGEFANENNEFANEFAHEYSNEYANEYSHEYGEAERPVFDEVQEMELAAELLEVTNEQELEQFLGKLIKGAGKAIGGFVKSPIGKQLGGMLKGVAKKALPMVGNALLPGIGGPLASAAGSLFGLELEGMSAEDREFEVARRYVRLAGAATRNAASSRTNAPPASIARNAMAGAARQHAPGLLRSPRARMSPRRGRGPAGYGAPPQQNNVAMYGSDPSYGNGNGNGNGYDQGDQSGYDQMAMQSGYGGQGFGDGEGSRRRSGRWVRRGGKIIILLGE